MSDTVVQSTAAPAAPPRLIIELTNICNLHCGYCLRDDDALHHARARFFPVELLTRIVGEVKDACGIDVVAFTGGEVTLHPGFADVVEAISKLGVQFGFVTNGWHFDRVYRSLLKRRDALRTISFSIDGTTEEQHDRWRGKGSFTRLMRAVTRCYALDLPFGFKVGVRRDTLPHLESFALFAARLGADAVQFAHLMPTSPDLARDLALTPEEQRRAEQEIAALHNILKIPVSLAVGGYTTNPEPTCNALRGRSYNVDYRGRLTLCCNLSGFRGASAETDVVADLNHESFKDALTRFQLLVEEQNERRRRALASAQDAAPDFYTGSPCLFCMQSFGKIAWRSPAVIEQTAQTSARTLPVIGHESLRQAM